jgi:hypothetical protein
MKAAHVNGLQKAGRICKLDQRNRRKNVSSSGFQKPLFTVTSKWLGNFSVIGLALLTKVAELGSVVVMEADAK